MKRILLAIASVLLLCATTGCPHHATVGGSGGCPNGNCGGLLGLMFGGGSGHVANAIHEARGWRHQPPAPGPAGPPVGTYAYPYYTLHGPRDFLADNPPSLGN